MSIAETNTETPKLALWRRVQHDLERQIHDGTLRPGARLATEQQLAREFNVHRHTIRRAIARLREKELVHVVHGKGAFVTEQHMCYRIGKATRMTDVILRHGRSPQRHILSSTEQAADRHVAALLSLPVGHPVCRMRSLRKVDGQPVSVATYFYPLPRFTGIAESIIQTGSISKSLASYGVTKVTRNQIRVRASLPSVWEANALQVGRGKPLIDLISVNRDQAGVPVQYVQSKMVSEYMDVVFMLSD